MGRKRATELLGLTWIAVIALAWWLDSTRTLLALLVIAVTALHGTVMSKSSDSDEDRRERRRRTRTHAIPQRPPVASAPTPLRWLGWH